jgi:hypothetical protein
MAGDGGYTDEFGQEIFPPGTRINGVPNATATATPGSPEFATPQGGQLVNTPNSSTGQPFRQAPTASTYQPSFTQPQGGRLTTTTPNSRTGAPAPGIRTLPPGVNPMTTPGIGGGLMTGAGALNAFPTPTPEQMTNTLNNPPLADDPWLIHSLSKLFGGGQAAPAAAPAPTAYAPTTMPVPQTGSSAAAPPGGGGGGYGGVPPGGFGPPPPGPFVRGPIPFNMPQRGVPRAPQGYNLGYGGAGPAAPPAAPSPMFTTIDRPNADISGGPTRGGWLSASYDPATGSNRGAREPGGPARMSALDLSGLFNRGAAPPAGALASPGWGAAAGTPNMNDAMLGMQMQNAGIPTGGRGARAQVPPAGKFFGNPANWQYPNMPF